MHVTMPICLPVRYITTEELEQALREYGMHDGRDILEIIAEVDADNVSCKSTNINQNRCSLNTTSYMKLIGGYIYFWNSLQDGRINYDEFCAMMRKGNPEANPKKRRDDIFV